MGKLLDAIDDPDLHDRIVAARAKAAELVKEWAAQFTCINEGGKDLDAPFEIVRLGGGKMLVKPRR